MLFIRFLNRNLKGYRLLVVLAVVMVGVQVGSDLLAALPIKFIPSKIQNPGSDPVCTYPFLDGVLTWFNRFDPNNVAQTTCPLSSPNPNLVTQHSTVSVIIFSVVLLLIFGTISALLTYGQLFIAVKVAQNQTARLRKQLFEHLQRLSLDWHGKQKKGDLVQRITGNIADIEKLVTDGLVDLLAAILTLIGIIAVMLFLSSAYTVIALTIVPALFMITLGYTKSIKAAAKKASKATGQVSDVATEDINALTVIKVFTREEKEALRFGDYVDKNRRAGLRAGGLQAQFAPLVSLLVILGTAAVLGVGGYVAANNAFHLGFFTIPPLSVDVGTLILFLTFLKLLYQPMRDLSKLTTLASTAGSGAERIQEVLDQAPEVLESSTPYNGPTRLQGDISFENVVFGYGSGQTVLKGINLRIPAGKKVALVGLSGGGKTTLVKLIPRFYEIQQGVVRIDGIDNRAYPLTMLRQNVSMVLQDSVLFEGTVAENIAIGKPGAPLYEVIEAAKKANIHETIIRDLGGYDGGIREQGKNLSGGQRQRMAIARAILRDAPILILDEPTAALDVESEAEVMHALEKLIVGRTVIMISHRLSTLGNVEEIIVLKNGQIAEQGSFQDLKRRGGVFAGLLAEQNRYNLEKAGDKSILRSAYAPNPDLFDPRQAQPQRPSFVPTQAVPPAGQNWPSPQVWPSPSMPQAPVYPQGNWGGNGQVQQQPQPLVAVPIAPQNARVLIEVDGKVVGERALNKPTLTIGRLSGNDVQIPSQRVSRLHAKIHEENGAWVIEDAESLNGVIYRGQRVDRLTFSNGDRVYLAPTASLQFVAQ